MYQLNKAKVAESFSKAAATYDRVADLQRQAGQALLERIPKRDYERMADLGCGTGHFTERVAALCQVGQLTGIDIALGMLKFARSRRPDITWLCADMEALPLAPESQDLLYSNLALQWCPKIARVFLEAHRVLSERGVFVFSTLGPRSLFELRHAWSQVDPYVHVNRFTNAEDIAAAARMAGFRLELEEHSVVRQFHSLSQLTQELKHLGARNMNTGRPPGLTGRNRMVQLIHCYERFRNEQKLLPVTYQLYYGVLYKSRSGDHR